MGGAGAGAAGAGAAGLGGLEGAALGMAGAGGGAVPAMMAGGSGAGMLAPDFLLAGGMPTMFPPNMGVGGPAGGMPMGNFGDLGKNLLGLGQKGSKENQAPGLGSLPGIMGGGGGAGTRSGGKGAGVPGFKFDLTKLTGMNADPIMKLLMGLLTPRGGGPGAAP